MNTKCASCRKERGSQSHLVRWTKRESVGKRKTPRPVRKWHIWVPPSVVVESILWWFLVSDGVWKTHGSPHRICRGASSRRRWCVKTLSPCASVLYWPYRTPPFRMNIGRRWRGESKIWGWEFEDKTDIYYTDGPYGDTHVTIRRMDWRSSIVPSTTSCLLHLASLNLGLIHRGLMWSQVESQRIVIILLATFDRCSRTTSTLLPFYPRHNGRLA